MNTNIKFSREFCTSNQWTFSIKPIRNLIDRYIIDGQVIVDPFAGKSNIATHKNDLKDSGITATEWLDGLINQGIEADLVLLDPPYSPRQIKECYESVGLDVTMKDTQNSRMYKEAKDRLDVILKEGGIAITCGWNSVGFGITRNYVMLEILLVTHGGAHNDTIVTVEQKGKRKKLSQGTLDHFRNDK